MAVAVNLLHGDLREPVPREERQEVARQLPLVVVDGARTELRAPGGEPLGRELVERWVRFDLSDGRGLWAPPGPRRTCAKTTTSSSFAMARVQPSLAWPRWRNWRLPRERETATRTTCRARSSVQ
jgi:hypothetical protein